MSQVFSEINKINVALTPAAQSSGQAAAPGTAAYETDTLSLKYYKKATFIFMAGTTVADTDLDLRPMCGSAVTTGSGAAAALQTYWYRRQSTGAAAYENDTPGALTEGTTAGVTMQCGGYDGGCIIFEIDSRDVIAQGTTDNYDCVKLHITSTTAADAPRDVACVAILSEPRYPKDVLDTAIS